MLTDFLPALTAPTAAVPDVYLDGIVIRPVLRSQDNTVAYYDATYVGMRIPGCYRTEDEAFDAVIAWVTDPDPWQRNFPTTVAGQRRIPGLA